jgi:hypothetical protein
MGSAVLLGVFIPASVLAANCSPIVCLNGEVFPTCDEKRSAILYEGDPCPKSVPPFSDTLIDDPYTQAIDALRQDGILRGYPDGTFRSRQPVSRVELIKMLLEVFGRYRPVSDVSDPVYSAADIPFSDVGDRQWYVPYLRRATVLGWIEGYPDGTVRPGSPVSFVEAAKLIARAYDLELSPSDPWYVSSIEALAELSAIPQTVTYLERPFLRGEMAEALWRLGNGIDNRPSKDATQLLDAHCMTVPGGQEIPAVDMERVRNAWLLWVNGERAALALEPYAWNEHLHRTAVAWSVHSAEQHYITHLRSGDRAPYDYQGILSWFSDLGVTFGNAYGSRYAENIAYGPMECTKSECTREMIGMLRAVFDAFMAEKGTGSDTHYRSVVHPDFRQIGIGLALDERKSNYYLTVHYAVDALSNDPPLCS